MKLDVCVDMPDVVDLAILRGYGVQPGEELLPVDGTFHYYSLLLMGYSISSLSDFL